MCWYARWTGEIKTISFSSWGEQNVQSSLCWGLHVSILSKNTNEGDKAAAMFMTKEIHMSLQNASVR